MRTPRLTAVRTWPLASYQPPERRAAKPRDEPAKPRRSVRRMVRSLLKL